MKAVIFDMDGTLIDSERSLSVIYTSVGTEFGIEFTTDHYISLIGRNKVESDEMLAVILGANVDKAAFIRRKDELKDIRDAGKIPLKEGAEELLLFLEGMKIPKAIATSTDRKKAVFKMTKHCLDHRFSFFICGDEVQKSKPHPEIYLQAAKQIGVKPEECWAIEDSLTGITSAYEAGMKVLAVPDMQPIPEEQLHMVSKVFSSLKEVQKYLDQELQKIPTGV